MIFMCEKKTSGGRCCPSGDIRNPEGTIWESSPAGTNTPEGLETEGMIERMINKTPTEGPRGVEIDIQRRLRFFMRLKASQGLFGPLGLKSLAVKKPQ